MRLLAHVQMERAAWFAVCFPYDVGEQASSTQYKLGEIQSGVCSSSDTECLHITSREQSACVLGI